MKPGLGLVSVSQNVVSSNPASDTEVDLKVGYVSDLLLHEDIENTQKKRPCDERLPFFLLFECTTLAAVVCVNRVATVEVSYGPLNTVHCIKIPLGYSQS